MFRRLDVKSPPRRQRPWPFAPLGAAPNVPGHLSPTRISYCTASPAPVVKCPISRSRISRLSFSASPSTFAPCQLRRPLRIRRPVLERSCSRAPFPAFRAVPVCPRLREPASAEFRPLGVWRSARVLRAQAAARPEDRPECLEREPAAVSFCSRPGPARAKTARSPAEFPQGAFRQKPAPSVTDRSRLQALLRILACPAGQTLRVEPDPGTMLWVPLGGPACPLLRDGPQRNASGASPSQLG